MARLERALEITVRFGHPLDEVYRLAHPTKGERWIHGRAERLGELVVGVMQDVTATKQLEQELERRVRARTSELEAANRELESFTYSISHDLRAPLRTIAATSEILLEEQGEVLGRNGVRLLLRQSESAYRLAALIDELLKLSRLGREPVERREIDLTALAQEVGQELEQQFAGCDLRVEEGMRATGDPRQVRIALQNLIENALKFSPDGRCVTVGSIVEGQDAPVFFVRDQGIGFDMAFSDKLFRPFERLVGESEYPGYGIGLANVERIVHRHSGKVWAESAPGEGSTFFFTLEPQRMRETQTPLQSP